MIPLLHLADCLGPAGLRSLSDKSVDHTITDPPYGTEVHTQGRRLRVGSFADEAAGRRKVVTKAISYPPLSTGDLYRVADQIVRVTRGWICVWCQSEDVDTWRHALSIFGARLVRNGIWWITDAQPQVSGDRPGVGWLPYVVAYGTAKGRMEWEGGGLAARHQGPSRDTTGDLSSSKYVDGQKPFWLMQDLVRLYSSEGDLILDPFAGAGTTLLAAQALKRRSIGYERLEAHYQIALRRLAGDDLRAPASQGRLAL